MPAATSVDGPGDAGLLRRLHDSPPGRALAEGAKAALRRYGVATAASRPLPDFLIVGAKRGGTTSLWSYLEQHPGVLPMFPSMQGIKGLYFFDEGYGRGIEWYRSHFPTERVRARAAARLGHPVVSGEATPYYLFHPLAPVRAARHAPDAHILVLLRDPVERAYSHWKERSRHTEELGFEAAIDAEEARTAGEEERILADPSYVSAAHRHQTYLAQGRYAPMLERWLAAYPEERVTILLAEEFYADPQGAMDLVCGRLGLPTHVLKDARPRNVAPSKSMDPAVRERLHGLFAEDIRRVEEIIGRSTSWSS